MIILSYILLESNSFYSIVQNVVYLLNLNYSDWCPYLYWVYAHMARWIKAWRNNGETENRLKYLSDLTHFIYMTKGRLTLAVVFRNLVDFIKAVLLLGFAFSTSIYTEV